MNSSELIKRLQELEALFGPQKVVFTSSDYQWEAEWITPFNGECLVRDDQDSTVTEFYVSN